MLNAELYLDPDKRSMADAETFDINYLANNMMLNPKVLLAFAFKQMLYHYVK